MNTYSKYTSNVFLAKCKEQHQKGDTITVTTRYGKENESIVYNLIYQKDGFYYYSIVRADGFNTQERAKRKSERLSGYSTNATNRSNDAYDSRATKSELNFMSLGEPIKIGHHSEAKHRKLFEKYDRKMRESINEQEKAEQYTRRAEYWEKKASEINISMPESLEFYTFELEKANEYHAGLKSGKYKCSHTYSLTYAKKKVNDLTKKVELAQKLWGNEAP